MTSRGIRGDFFWSAAELAMRYGVQFVTLVILARLVAPSDFGLMAIVMVVVAIGNVISDSGMTVALTRLPDATSAHFATASRFGSAAGMGCVVTAAALAWPIAWIFDTPRITWLLIAASLSLPAIGATTGADAKLIRDRHFAERAQSQALASTGASVAAIAVAIAGGGAWALVTQLVIASFLRMVLLRRRAPTYGRFSRRALADLTPLSGYLMASGLLDALANRLQAVLLGKMFGTNELGFYAQAQNIQQVATTAFSAIVNKVGLLQFAKADGNGRLEAVARTFLMGTYLVFCPLMLLAALLAPPLIPVVLGLRWQPMTPIFVVLSLAAALWPVHVVNLLVCTTRGDGNAFFRLELLKKAVLVCAVAAVGWRGPVPMALAVLSASVIGAVINASYSSHAIAYGPLRQGRDLLPATAAAAAAAAVAWGLNQFLGLTGALAALSMAVVFLIIYALPGAAMGRRTLTEWNRLAVERVDDVSLLESSSRSGLS